MPRRRHLLPILILMLSLSACSSNKYLVQPADTSFQVDGDQVEWAGRFQIPKGESFALGLSSNKNYLYLALTSMDMDFQRRLAMSGLTLWLDVKGGKHQSLGIKYQSKFSRDRRRRDANSNYGRGVGSDRENGSIENLRLPSGDMDIIVINEKGRERFGPSDLLASAQTKDGSLFIEYQIPLALLSPNFDITGVLGLGIESKFERPERSDSRPGGITDQDQGTMQGGRSRGQMSGGGHSPGGNRPGGPNQMGQDNLEFWMKLQFPQK